MFKVNLYSKLIFMILNICQILTLMIYSITLRISFKLIIIFQYLLLIYIWLFLVNNVIKEIRG